MGKILALVRRTPEVEKSLKEEYGVVGFVKETNPRYTANEAGSTLKTVGKKEAAKLASSDFELEKQFLEDLGRLAVEVPYTEFDQKILFFSVSPDAKPGQKPAITYWTVQGGGSNARRTGITR